MVECNKTYGIKFFVYNKYPKSVFNILRTEIYIDNGHTWELIE